MSVYILMFLLLSLATCSITDAKTPTTFSMESNCDQTLSFSDSMILTGSNLTSSCSMDVATDGDALGLLIDITSFSLPPECNTTLEIVHPLGPRISGKLCGTKLSTKVFNTSVPSVELQYETDTSDTDATFSIILTSLKRGPIGSCFDDAFRCSNHFCIAKALVCNGVDECADNSDETRGCDSSQARLSSMPLFTAVVTFLAWMSSSFGGQT
ncbi:membrane frizzled-related protein-like [Haliotis asinina]|uniref:membrane frizzled-related protein-like n=1 Tax=Haliotis asinina TaxID=109174 RepID=UPI0035318A92